MSSNFDGIILDLDGTIWNPTSIAANAYNKAIEKMHVSSKKITAEILQEEFGKPMNKIALSLWPNISDDDRDKLVSCVLSEEQIELENISTDVNYPGVIETLKKISEASKKIFVVSNCHEGYMQVALEKTRISNLISDYEYFGRTMKPKCENIRLVMERNGIKSAVYVGDTQGDADACKKANVPFIWASYGFGKVNDFWAKIDKFTDLIDIVLK